MKVRDAIKELLEYNLDAELEVSTGDTFDDVSDFSFSYGGPDSGDGELKKDTKHVYINVSRSEGNFIEQIKVRDEVYNLLQYKQNKFNVGDTILIPYMYYNKFGYDFVKSIDVNKKAKTFEIFKITDITDEKYILENRYRLGIYDADKVIDWSVYSDMFKALEVWIAENADDYISLNNHNEVYLADNLTADLMYFLECSIINSENLDAD